MRRKIQNSCQEIENFQDLRDMEVDNFTQILDWVAIELAESRASGEELSHECPIVFYDDFVTLHHANYQRDSRNILL